MAGDYSNTPAWLDLATKELLDATHQRANRATGAAWVPPGTAVTVNEVELPDGMIYLGERLTPVESWFGNVEPALVNPRLRTQGRPRTHVQDKLGYRVSYANLSPQHRSDYLNWLATGRRNPDIGIDFVRLFFFGLERRVIYDMWREFDTTLTAEAEQAELQAIAAEVEALVATYRYEADFVTQATEFVSVLHAMAHDYPTPPSAPPSASSRWNIPEYLRFSLGCFARNAQPIPAMWALRWLQTSSFAKFRTPSKRCPQEFTELWRFRYEERFGDGLVLENNQYKLDLEYRPDTWSMLGVFEIPTELPAVQVQRSHVGHLVQLASDCEDELVPYSRYVGSAFAERGSVAARALLPAPLIDGTDSALDKMKSTLERAMSGHEHVTVEGTSLIRLWNSTTAPLNRADAASFAHLLGALGYGIEPDVRFGGKPLGQAKAVLFHLAGGEQQESQAYIDASFLLDVAYFVAAADKTDKGKLDPVRLHALGSMIEGSPELTATERTRLGARLAWWMASMPTLNGLKARFRHVTHQSADVAQAVVQLANVGGFASADAVNALDKVYKLLDLDRRSIATDVHHNATRPAASAPALAPGFTPRPAAARTDTGGFAIDMDRVQATIAESDHVSTLLGEIFSEDDAPDARAKAPALEEDTLEDAAAPLVEGLDAAHSELLRTLATKAFWLASEVSQASERLHLLPGGAIDTLNEVAFDRIGDPVCDGDGDITVDLEVAQELLK